MAVLVAAGAHPRKVLSHIYDTLLENDYGVFGSLRKS